MSISQSSTSSYTFIFSLTAFLRIPPTPTLSLRSILKVMWVSNKVTYICHRSSFLGFFFSQGCQSLFSPTPPSPQLSLVQGCLPIQRLFSDQLPALWAVTLSFPAKLNTYISPWLSYLNSTSNLHYFVST